MPVRRPNSRIERTVDFPDSRARVILSAIINEHFVTGEPVGSKAIAESFANVAGLSSATIRSVMAELDELDLIEQPHTSAGRVPTDKGYRFYVDNLLGVLSLSNEDLSVIGKEFGPLSEENFDAPNRLMERTSQLLSALSNNVGIVVSPSLAKDRLQHIEFLNLSDKRVLVVMVSGPEVVHHRIIRLGVTFTKEELEQASNYLNAEFSGQSLIEIRNRILGLMHEEKALFDKLLQNAVILCSQSIEDVDEETNEVFVEGTTNILSKKDFNDLERLRGLLSTIGERSKLLQILNECVDKSSDGVKVVIGSENSSPTLRGCSLITAPYRIGDSSAFGTLSVLGPTRIEYARMISIVSYVARILEKALAHDVTRN